MRIPQLLAATAVAAAFAAPSAMASDFTPSAHANVAVGWTLFDHERGYTQDAEFQYGAEWRFAENFAAELQYTRGDTTEKYSGDRVSRTAPYREYTLNGLYYFNGEENLQPRVLVGLGHAEFDDNGIYGARNEFRVHLGGGGRYIVQDGFSLHSDLTSAISPRDKGLVDFTLTLGFSLDFQLNN